MISCIFCGWSCVDADHLRTHSATCDAHPAVQRATKLQAFKDWVHAYLDAQGVPHHPPGTHGAEGCRIGDRMDWVFDQLRAAQEDRG